MDFTIPADHKMKESKKIYKFLDLARELKKVLNQKVTVILIVVCTLGMIPKDLKKNEGTGDQRKNQDHLDHNTVKIS